MGLKGVANVGGGTIGGPVIGGTATRVLFVGAGPVLADSANLTFNPTGSLLTLGTDAVVSRYAAKQVMISGDGTGTASGMTGWILGNRTATVSAIYGSQVTPGAGNWVLQVDANDAFLNAPARDLYFYIAGAEKGLLSGTAGRGLSITAGTATTDVAALSVTRTNNDAAVATGVKFTFTDTTSAAGFLPFQVLGGSGGTTNLMSLSKVGGAVFGQDIQTITTGFIGWQTRSLLSSPADGVITLQNAALTDFSMLKFGGTTSSFPALKRSSAVLEVKLADDSAYGDAKALHFVTTATDFMAKTVGTLANGAAASVGTLTNAPAAGNPTKWVPIDDNGTTRYIPAW